MFDITEKWTFFGMSLICIGIGVVIGGACAWLFDIVSHVMVLGTRYDAVPIPVFWGIVFILIMAATAFMIALTFRYIPGWVANYYQNRTVPPVIARVIAFLRQLDKEIQEGRKETKEGEDPDNEEE